MWTKRGKGERGQGKCKGKIDEITKILLWTNSIAIYDLVITLFSQRPIEGKQQLYGNKNKYALTYIGSRCLIQYIYMDIDREWVRVEEREQEEKRKELKWPSL